MEDFQPRAPINFSSILDLLEENAKKYPYKEAIISVDPHNTEEPDILDYQTLKDLVFKTAALLDLMGIKKGDRYAILMENSTEVLIFELAGALIGATTVPLDAKRDTLERKIYKLKETNAKVLFTNFKEELPGIKTVIWKDFSSFKKLLPQVPKNLELNNCLNTHYVILYTSGTTSLPKGVSLSIRACLLNAMGIAVWQKITDKEIFNVCLPLHHINSTIFCLSVLLCGGTIVLNKTYSSSKFWHVVSKFSCTNTSIVPTILHDLLARKDEPRPDVSSLKKICIGSAPVLPEQTMKFYQTFKIRVTQGYGQTETALRVAGVPVDLPENTYIKMLKSNSIGCELANNKLAIMTYENNLKREGEHGEICIFGPTLADGYLNDPKATKEAFKKGWFHSGDLGYFKGDYYYIVGRIKEIIIKGGINISPSAIEDALLKSYPEIKEVCVVGYPDLRMGEEIAAIVVIKEGLSKEELEKKILSGGKISLSRYDLPKKVIFFDSLPKTSTGKIQRVEVKNQINSSVRIIKPDETEVLKKAVEINNEGFKDVPSTVEEVRKRAKNAMLFGAFDSMGQLVGSLSCVQLNMSGLQNMKTWEEVATAHNPKGDTLVCIAISVKRQTKGESLEGIVDEKLAKEKIEEYVQSGQDHVLNFHAKNKGGLPGATIWKILEQGRKEDKESMGYNVLLKYPQISKETKIIKTPQASPGFKLIEQALSYAFEKGIENVVAFSRPAGFRKYLLSL